MDRRLLEAAQTGNVQHLHQMLKESPHILHSVALASAENPLHVASIGGHVEFAKEILRWKPEFARELNQDGLSPMHMAAANRHVEIVRELLRVDENLCRLEGREKKTPLHYAAVKGRVDVIAEMLLACPECVEDVSVHGETALHLAVKHSQFEAVKVLVEWVVEMKKNIVNFKDEQGNTILHIAAWKKQRQVIELLLCNGATTSLAMEVNAINHSGLTALDLLMIFPSEAGDREIQEILRAARAISARDSHNLLTPAVSSLNQTAASRTRSSLMQPKNLVEYFKFKKGRDSPSNARNSLLVISVLVATATYQVGLSPPGGVWQDGDLRGQAIMGYNSPVTFLFFMLFNSVGFSVSLFMINILTANFPMRFELLISTVTMFVTYAIAVVTIAPNQLKLYIIIFTSVLPSMVRPVAKGFMDAPAHRTCWLAVKGAVRSTAFLSAFVGIFQGVICTHRKVASKDHKLVYWIAGSISALSVLLEKKATRSELALYVLPRAGESLWYILVNRQLLPDIRNAEVFLFCMCMGGIMYYLEYEPDTMAPFLRGLIRRFLASRISNPGSLSNRNASSAYLQALDAIKDPKLPETQPAEASASQKYNLESIPGL